MQAAMCTCLSAASYCASFPLPPASCFGVLLHANRYENETAGGFEGGVDYVLVCKTLTGKRNPRRLGIFLIPPAARASSKSAKAQKVAGTAIAGERVSELDVVTGIEEHLHAK